MEISDDVKRAYKYASEFETTITVKCLAQFARDALAEAMEARHFYAAQQGNNCERCHWPKSDWQAAADKELRGERWTTKK